MRKYIHFSSYDQMFKELYVLDQLMSCMHSAWIPCNRLTIDESMICYMGHAIEFVQYMLRKPIKHGLEVSVVCCVYTAVLFGFEVYCGADAENDHENSELAAAQCLVQKACLSSTHGRTLVYRQLECNGQSCQVAFSFSWVLFCGTMRLTKKVAC
jgi:hypothetical protein